jgi:diamine N-acetyltransferase
VEESILETVAVRLVDVDGSNWRQVVRVAPHPDQERFVGPVANYLCLCHYEGEWSPLAIEADGVVVGHVMWGIDEEDDSIWMGGLVIDAASQRRGIGREAVVAFIDRFVSDGHTNMALSCEPDNVVARNLYAGLGFVETGEMEGDEVVARRIS